MIEDAIVSFPYGDQIRTVLVAKVWESKAGARLITGLDETRNDIRTFRIDRITWEGTIYVDRAESARRA